MSKQGLIYLFRQCSISECERKHFGRGYCRKHYCKWRQYGDPLFTYVNDATATLRLLAKINKNGENGCWLWEGAKKTNGYGKFFYNGKNQAAHRIAYKLLSGIIPDGACILHKCDNPICVNPNHLSTGSHADMAVLATERRDILAESDVVWGDLPEPMPEIIQPWGREYACHAWMRRFEQYGGSVRGDTE